MPDSFDQFPDASTALAAAQKRDSWNVFPDAKDAFQLQKARNAPGVYPGEGPVPRVQWGPFTQGAVGGGMLGAGQRIGSLLSRVPGAQSLGMPASAEFHQAHANLEADRQAAGETWTEGLVRGATENLLPMALTSPAGVATSIAGGSAITADQAYETGKSKGLSGANLAGYVSSQAGAEALGEILPAKLGGSILTLMQKARKAGVSPERAFWTAAKSIAGDAAGEAGTQAVQNAIDYHAGVDPKALDFNRLAGDVGQAVAQSVLMGAAVTAPHVGLAALEKRLTALQAVTEKGYVSAEDGQKNGIAGGTRKARLEDAKVQITQLNQEIQNASTVPSPQAQVRQPESGQDIRGNGKNQAPAEPAGEVPQVRVEPQAIQPPTPAPVDERKAMLHALGAAEAAAPEQPKSDVSAEIRDALAQGPVTVSAPQVQGGFKVSKVRDDGRVVTNHGKIITPDETWTIKPQKPAEATPAAAVQEQSKPEPKPERPVGLPRRIPRAWDYRPDQARGWLQDAISRRPSTVNTPKEISDWIMGGFDQGNWRSYAEKQGHTSLEQSVAKVMDEMSGKPPTTEQPKTRMDMILDEAERSGKEMNVQLQGATPDVLDRAIKAANDRGMWATTDGNNLLIRPKQEPVQPTINNPQSGKEVTNGQEENQGQGRKGVLAPETPSIETAAVGEVPKASPTAVPKRTGRKVQAVAAEPTKPKAEPTQTADGQRFTTHEATYDGKQQTVFKSPSGKEIGEISLKPRDDGNLEVSNVLVWPEFQRQGFATDFYKHAQSKAAEIGKRLFISNDRTADAKALHSDLKSNGILKDSGEISFGSQPVKPEPPVESPPQAQETKPVEAKQPEFALSRGRKPAEPHPELEKAGIKLKATPKGWSVTGISKEIGDGLKTDYQGKQTGNGYFFNQDPTQALVDSARATAAEAERDVAERAAGRVKTSVGYMEAEQAQAFTAERDERLKLKRDHLAERADAVEQLVGQFIPKKNRGQFKLELLRAKENGDADTLKSFDLMTEYSKDHPELGLPQNETDLFNLLAKPKEAIDESALSDEVHAELLSEAGDFNFGANVTEATQEPKQTAIPGTEEAVARQERREEYQRAKPVAETPKAKQTAFISGLDTDLPGQNTLFNVDRAGGDDTAADRNAGSTSLQQAADKAVQEAHDELDSFVKMLGDKGLFSNPMLDPEVIAGAGRVVAKFVKAGTLKFAALMEHLAKSIGQAAVDRIRPALESEWDRLQKSNSGMEPRTPETQAEKPPPGGHELTGIKKEVVNDLRALVGLPEMEGSTPQTVEEWAENARITLAADPKAAIRLVNELAMNARPITQSDVTLLQFRYRQLANDLAPVVDDYFEAVKSKDPVAIATAKSAVTDARKAMTDFEETIHPSKETWGRTGVALQQMLRKDFSIEAVLRRGQEANDGEELSPDQTAELTAMAKKFQDLQSQFEAQRKKSEELEAELASKRQHEEAVASVKQDKVHRKSGKRQAAEKKVADAWEKFRQASTSTAGSSGANLIGPAVDVAKAYVELGYVRFSEFIAAARQNIPGADEKLFLQAWDQATADAGIEAGKLDPNDRAELSKAAREIQRELVGNGMTDREQVIQAVHAALQEELPDLTRRQTMDALSRYGIFQRQSQNEIEKLIRGMNSEILKLSQIDQMETAMKRVDKLRAEGKTDEEIGKALDKEKLLVEATGLVRDRPSQTVRQLTQKYNELKKSIPATPANKAGMLQTTLNQMERALRNRISDLKFEIDRREKVVKEKRERPTSETIKSLESERDSLVKIHKEMFPPKKPSEAQRIASAIRGSDKAIAQLEQQISTQDFDVEHHPKLSSPELDARRSRLEQLRAARKALKAMEAARMEGEGGHTTGKVPLSDAELARRAYESSLRSRIADYQQLLAEGDFSPKPKKQPRTLTESELKLRRQMEDVRHEVLQKYADYHLAHLTGIHWEADKLAEASRLSRAMMTFVDLPLLRQGGVIAAGRPVMTANVMKNVIEEIAGTFGGMKIDSRQAEFNLMHKLTEGPEGEFMQRAGLQLPSSDEKITRQEEAFQGRWAKWVPGVSLGGRLYTMIMNTLRVHEFRTLVENLGRGGQATPSEGKLLAHFVNIAAGRSDLKGVPFLQALEQQSHLMNEVFFASRWVMSRIQYLALPGYLPFRGGLKNDWRAKRVIYKEMGRQMAGTATVLGIVALAAKMFWDDDDKEKPRVGVDPTSSDFLKIVSGESRIDLLYGFSQIFVLASRVGLQRTTSSGSGKTRKFGEGYEPETTLSTLERFGRTKLAPVPGAITTIANNWTNVVGQPETPLSLAAGLFAPVSLGDVYQTMISERVPKAVSLAMLGELGASVSTYGPRTQFVTGNAEQRQKQIEGDLKRMQWDSPEAPAYSEFLTSDQLEQFRQSRQEKRGLVVYNATYSGTDPDEIKTRDKNREHLTDMGVSKDDALQLLKDYYKAKEGGLRVHGGTGLKPGYAKRIGGLNSIYGK